MYYIGMKFYEDLEVIESPLWNEEIKELLNYFYEHYNLIFVINGNYTCFENGYTIVKIKDKINEWLISWRLEFMDHEKKENYLQNLEKLKALTFN